MQRIPDTTADARLSGLESFLEFWLGPRHPEYGVPPDELAKRELPEPLRRFYAFAGRWPPAHPPHSENRFSVQDSFLPLDSCYRSGPRLVFVTENQGVWHMATLPSGDDPDVWVSEECSHRSSSPIWRPLGCSLSQFLVTFVLQELMFGCKFGDCQENALSVFQNAGAEIEPI
jgi:hypothetical protein